MWHSDVNFDDLLDYNVFLNVISKLVVEEK